MAKGTGLTFPHEAKRLSERMNPSMCFLPLLLAWKAGFIFEVKHLRAKVCRTGPCAAEMDATGPFASPPWAGCCPSTVTNARRHCNGLANLH